MSSKVCHRLSCPTSMVTHLCVCSDIFIAVPLNERGNIAIWNTSNLSQEPSILIGHHKTVTALALSHYPANHFLCSCSSDNIILWNLMENEGQPSKGRVLHSHMEQPMYCSFSSDNLKVAISFPTGMWIFDLQKNSWISLIEGTQFMIFTFHFENNILLGVEENVLKIWDFETREVSTKISISVGSPMALCVLSQSSILVIGTTCGHLNIYGINYNLIRCLHVWKLIAQHLKVDSSEEGALRDFRSDNFPIYSIQIFNFEKDKDSEICLFNEIYLLVVTSTCLFILRINNEEVVYFMDFNNYSDIDEKKTDIGLVRSGAIACASDNFKAYVTLIPVMDEYLILLKLSLKDLLSKGCQSNEKKSTTGNIQTEANELFLTFLNSNHTANGESLLIPKTQKNKSNKCSRKVMANLNLPITFHSNIKSSGYGTLHKPATLFQPQIPKDHRNRLKNCTSFETVQNHTGTKEKNKYESYGNSLNLEKLELFSKIESFENPVVSSLQVTVDGQYVSCASSDGLIDVLKLGKKHLKVCHTITAHKGKANAAKWSHSKRLLVTAGNDKTVKLWNLENHYPLLTIGVDQDNLKTVGKHKFVFEEEVEQIQFYYLDRFLLAAAGNKVHLFDYIINIEKSGIKSYLNKSSLKLVKKIPLDTKRITSLAAMNQFFSNLVLCTGTSKNIDILDMITGKVICHITDAVIRPAHLISLNEGSPYTSQTSSMYDLFLTSSLFDGIKVWDLRTTKPVLCFKEHKCRSVPCGAAFSACGKYIATGSEDKSIYIYDLRQLAHQHKINETHVDVFTSVAFSPKSQENNRLQKNISSHNNQIDEIMDFEISFTSLIGKKSRDFINEGKEVRENMTAQQVVASSLNGLIYLYGEDN